MEEARKIIRECLLGNRSAQRSLLSHYSPMLMAVAYRYVRNEADAKDVLQESWIRIFKYLDQYKEEGKLEGWLKVIVIRVALRHLQNAKKKYVVPVEDAAMKATHNENALDKMSLEEILCEVDKVPGMPGQVFKLKVIEGYSHKEIGDLLGIKESTSRAHLTHARKKLKERILFNEQIVLL